MTAEGSIDYIDKLLNNFPEGSVDRTGKQEAFRGGFGPHFFIFELDDWIFTTSAAEDRLLKHSRRRTEGFWRTTLEIRYYRFRGDSVLSGPDPAYAYSHITALSRIEEDRYVRLDKFTVRSLELVGTMNDEGTSLLDVIDKTISPMALVCFAGGYYSR